MTSENCIFCKIAAGKIPAAKIFEDDNIAAFEDIHPQAPVHFLVIPKKHIATMDDLRADDAAVVGQMLIEAAKIARDKGIGDSGYRLIINCRDDGGQEVDHLHLHVLGGRPMGRMVSRP